MRPCSGDSGFPKRKNPSVDESSIKAKYLMNPKTQYGESKSSDSQHGEPRSRQTFVSRARPQQTLLWRT